MKKRAFFLRCVALLATFSLMLTLAGCHREERAAVPTAQETESAQEQTAPETTAQTEAARETAAQTMEETGGPWQIPVSDTHKKGTVLTKPEKGSDYDRTAYSDVYTEMAEAAAVQEKGGIPENTRPGYDAANCHTLAGNPYVLVVFLDDDVSSWPEEKILTYWEELLTPGMTFIEENAAAWDVELDFQCGYYATYGHPDRPVKYNGVVDTHMNGTTTKDILEQVAASLGFDSKDHMHERLQDFSGQDQIAYIIMLNKGGRSYTIRYHHSERTSTDRDRYLEYCVIYTGFTDDSGDTASDTIAHEMLHLYGADDYYRPDSREALASALYPDDIMLCAKPDLQYFNLGEMTAYCVGWTDEAPEVTRNPDWWE